MSFLPENYVAPRTSNGYMKLQEGENRIRILTRPIVGWEDWREKKPVRFLYNEKPSKPFDASKPVKHFWAFVVYNYNEQRIQILHITQASIRKSLEDLSRDNDWGVPFSYDVKIFKKGEGKDTEYSVNPVPHKPVDTAILDEYRKNPCNLEALFYGEDPFSKMYSKYTVLGLDEVAEKPEKSAITEKQIQGLEEIFLKCDPAYMAKLWKSLKQSGITVGAVSEIPPNLYDRIHTAALVNAEEYCNKQAVEELEEVAS